MDHCRARILLPYQDELLYRWYSNGFLHPDYVDKLFVYQRPQHEHVDAASGEIAFDVASQEPLRCV
jgi:hypothetical protein